MALSELGRVLEKYGISDEHQPVLNLNREYSGYEVVLIATEIEKTGYAFYTRAQKLAVTRELGDVFEEMAREELEHIKILHRDIAPAFRSESCYSWENEEAVSQYLYQSADSKIFHDMEELKDLMEEVTDAEQAIDICIAGERRSVSFYRSLLDQTSSPEGIKAIKQILEEEKKHVTKLEDMKKNL